MRRILLVKLAAIGDVTILSGALAELQRESLEEVELHWIIDPVLEPLAAELLGAAGAKVRFHGFAAAELFSGGVAGALRGAGKLAALARSVRPDMTVVFHRDWRYRLLLRLALNAPVLGLAGGKRSEFGACLDLLRRCGLPAAPSSPGPAPLKHRGPWRVGLLVGGAKNAKVLFEEKKWPHLQSLAIGLLSDDRLEVELFGGPDDCAEAESISAAATALGVAGRLKNHVGMFSLAELPQAISRMNAFVGVDSGLSHIAARVMAPGSHVFTLFGPTDPRVWAPTPAPGVFLHVLGHSLPCSPCYLDDGRFTPCPLKGVKHRACMKGLPAETVKAQLLDFL